MASERGADAARAAKMRELIQELELSLEHSRRKQAVLTETVTATSALLQEATQRKAELAIENQLMLQLLRRLDTTGASLPEGLCGEAAVLSPELSSTVDFLAESMLTELNLGAEPSPEQPSDDSRSEAPSSHSSAGAPFHRRPTQQAPVQRGNDDRIDRSAANGAPGVPGAQGNARTLGNARTGARQWINCD